MTLTFVEVDVDFDADLDADTDLNLNLNPTVDLNTSRGPFTPPERNSRREHPIREPC